MSLQVCNAPGCKAITLMDYCETHLDQGEYEDDEEPEDLTHLKDLTQPEPRRPTDEDLVASVMKVVRNHPSVQKKETTMGTPSRICQALVRTGTRCTTGCARASDYCQRHADQREATESKSRHVAPAQLPAKRPRAPIALADPIVVNPPATNGAVSFAGIDALIANAEQDLAALKRVRGIVERESA